MCETSWMWQTDGDHVCLGHYGSLMRRWGCANASFDRQRRRETEVLGVFAQAEDVAGLETVRVGVATHSNPQSYIRLSQHRLSSCANRFTS